MMLKKIFILFFFLFLSSCGYEAIHSKKNVRGLDFSINELNFIGDKTVNLKIKERLNNYTINKKDKNFSLTISSSSQKNIISKNTSGDPSIFKNTIVVDVKILKKDKFENNLKIIEGFNYNNNSNKFELKKYEKEIKNNLAKTVADKLIFKLSNIQ